MSDDKEHDMLAIAAALGLVTRDELDARVRSMAEHMWGEDQEKRRAADMEWREVLLGNDALRDAAYEAECEAAAERHRVGMIAGIATLLIVHDKVDGETEATSYARAIIEKAEAPT